MSSPRSQSFQGPTPLRQASCPQLYPPPVASLASTFPIPKLEWRTPAGCPQHREGPRDTQLSPLGVGIIGAMEELSGPARQVTRPCGWHLGFSSSILSQKRLEFVGVYFSACKTVSCHHQKQQHSKAPPWAAPPSASATPSSLGNLRGPSDFPLSLYARVTRGVPQRGLGSSSRTSGSPAWRIRRKVIPVPH